MGTRRLIVEVVGDSRSLQRTFSTATRDTRMFGAEIDSTTSRFGRLNQSLRGALSGAGGRSSLLFGSGAFLSTAALTGGLKLSIDAASDLNEQITKSEQVFGRSSEAILDWSKTTAKAIGVSREQALEAAGTFGNLFASIHLGASESADTSRRLVQLAADLASFNNADPGQVLQDLRSGLVGEAEPLRKYGILLSEARVQQEALRETGKTSIKSLTDQEKALARVNIIFRDSSKAQGDFARTSDGLANQQRILAAQIKDTEAQLGTALLPVVKQAVRQFSAAATGVSDLFEGLRKLSAVRVPPIHIPLVIDQGDKGSTLGDIAGKALFTLGDFVDLTEKVVQNLIDDFKTSTVASTPELAAQFEDVMGGFFQNALNQATANVPPPTVQSAPFQGALGSVITSVIQQAVGIAKKDVQAAIASEKKGLQDAAKDAAAQRLQDQFNALIDSLRLSVDQAGLTAGLNDDLRALEALKAGLEKQVKAGVDVTAAQSQLVTVVQAIRDKQDEIRAKAAEAVQARQFRALGLSVTGEEIVPGVENLQRQLRRLSARLADSGEQLPSKLTQQLEGARKVLSGKLGQVTKESRDKINELFKTIRSTFDQGARNAVPERRTVQLSDRILAALGFGVDSDVSRLNKLGSASTIGTSGAFAKAAMSPSASLSGVTITGPVTVVADNPDAFLRELQKKAGRTSGTARGRFPGRSLGLG